MAAQGSSDSDRRCPDDTAAIAVKGTLMSAEKSKTLTATWEDDWRPFDPTLEDLHVQMEHPDFQYAVVRGPITCPPPFSEGWEPNRHARCDFGEKCWMRRRRYC